MNKKTQQFDKTITVDKKSEGLRLDVFLTQINLVPTRTKVVKLITKKHVFLSQKTMLNPKASYRLHAGDKLKIIFPKQQQILKHYNFPLDIAYEDDHILVVNKPAGLIVHPASTHQQTTLVNILSHQKKLPSDSDSLRPGIVHRLDKAASGLMIVAKTMQAKQNLIKQFKEHRVQRQYWTLSLRPPCPIQGKVETWLKRHKTKRQKFISLKKFEVGSKKAVTLYKLFREGKYGICWLKCHLKTGRTHQIRAHLSSIECPILGDELYGGKKKLSFITDSAIKQQIKNLNRIALHSKHLSLLHPMTKKHITITCSWPKDMHNILKMLDFL